ncbi:P-loop containing nucleoside triphosphate hydrolase protein [Lophium mytilinum]|uniref:P-loop containing nucleoside triphosphate hydrolase protein n=1 Tax=Lophium mytilinum TaxID=390894 RepID=A0A6A6QF86_9PEZI|nr:P-loop containing nucleoside triphosphate hydrolase protein [Lophium mytilinum]
MLSTFAKAHVTVALNTSVHKGVVEWLSANVISKGTRYALATTTAVADGYGLIMKPASGKYTFWFRKRFFTCTIETTTGGKESQKNDAMVISTLAFSTDPIEAFLRHCKDLYDKNHDDTEICVYTWSESSEGSHFRPNEKAPRSFDTIYMDGAVKADVIKDVDKFFDEETKEFYGENGIPYRRGYLLHGPPGTAMDDSSILDAFQGLGGGCVVVLEDVDSAGITRENGKKGNSSSKLTLSGLLNAIDGNAAPDDRLLIMTSNCPDDLDEALVRPGRIDRQIYLGHISQSSAAIIFTRLVAKLAAREGIIKEEEVEPLAQRFAEQIPEDTVTPAEVQNFLQMRRGEPLRAIDEVGPWVADLIAKRQKVSES